MMLKKTFLFLLLFLIADLSAFTPFSWGDETQRREYIIKASFILKFPAFIKWPEETRPINLCTPPDDPHGRIWEILEKNTANLIPFSFHFLDDNSEPENCQIIFASSANDRKIKNLVSGTKGKPVLIIGDAPGNLEKGVGINFLVVENRIRFEINRDSLRTNQLKVSSELLGLAYRVLEK